MVHYAVVVNGKVVGSRSSKSHAQQIYTHAVVVQGGTHKHAWNNGTTPVDGVMSYHSSEALARSASGQWSHLGGTLSVVPVSVTAKRAKVGDLVVPQGVL